MKLRKSRKLVSILVTLSMLMVLLVPLAGVASAGTSYSTTTTLPSFDAGSDSANYVKAALVEVNINPYTDAASGALLEVVDESGRSLPIVSINPTPQQALDKVANVDAKIYQYTFEADDTDGREAWQTLQIYFDGSNANSGPVKAKFSKPSGQLVAGDVTIANCKGGAIEVSVPTVVSISDAGCDYNDDNAITIRVNETVNGGFDKGENSVKFKLPNGFKWNDAAFETLNKSVGGDFYADIKDDGRTLAIDNDTDDYSGTILLEIKAGVEVDSTIAKYGEIKVKVSGESTVSPSEIVVGTYGDFEAKAVEVSVETVMSGQLEQEIGKFAIEEALSGTLVANRTIILTLPEQAKWDGDELPRLSTGDSDNIGDFKISAFKVVGTDNRTIKATVEKPSTGDEPTKIVFKDGQITVRADYTGPIELAVSGSAGIEAGTVKVADAKAPVTAAADTKPDVIIGMGSQAAGDVTITETEMEALQSTYDGWGFRGPIYADDDYDNDWVPTSGDAYLVLIAPPGVRFADEPTFSVTGDLQIGDPLCESDSQEVAVRIRATSSDPASVKISDIKLIVDRTVPEGAIQLKVGGTSLVENNIEGYFPNVNWVTKVAVANVVTPAPTDTQVTTVFTIGSNNYVENGVAKTMDVAPYIKGDRTYLPIRFVAYACGINDNNIVWNGADQSVLLIKGDRVVKLVIGSNTMMINGVPFAMDVAPEIVDPGRTMLPIRWVAQAFGCNIQWDAATQTVTVN